MTQVTSLEEVFEALSSEIDYQDAGLGNSETDRTTVTVGEGIILMQHYMNLAICAFAKPHPTGRLEALDIVRKIGGLACRTMMENGAPLRRLPLIDPKAPRAFCGADEHTVLCSAADKPPGPSYLEGTTTEDEHGQDDNPGC